jgi:hypothetical protein
MSQDPSVSSAAGQPALIRPAARYGDASPGRKRLNAVVITAVGLTFVGGIVALGWSLSQPDFTTQLRAYQVVNDRSVKVEYLVRVRDPQTTVTCIVRARDRESNEIGRTEVTSKPGLAEQVLTITLRTTVRANLGEIQGCQLTR